MEENLPIVRVIDGQVVLDDPAALGVIQAIENHNKAQIVHSFMLNHDRIEYFLARMDEINLSPDEYCVIIACVDDENGSAIADVLMPGYDWQSIRDLGQVPFARGFAKKDFLIHALEFINPVAAEELKNIKGKKVTIVIDCNTADIY